MNFKKIILYKEPAISEINIELLTEFLEEKFPIKVEIKNNVFKDFSFEDIKKSCSIMNIALVGGHTEITPEVNSPIAIGCLIGEVDKNMLLRTSGANINDDILISGLHVYVV